MPHSSGSLLLGLDGVVVESVTIYEDGALTVHVGTAHEWTGVCPQCRRHCHVNATSQRHKQFGRE